MKTLLEFIVFGIALVTFGICYILMGEWRNQDLENTEDIYND